MAVYTYDPGTQEVEAEGSEVIPSYAASSGRPGLSETLCQYTH